MSEAPSERERETILARRMADGDPEALDEIYGRLGSITFGFLIKALNDRALAEDVQQQVYLEVWRTARNFDPARGSLLTWVMTIARSRAIDQLRRRTPEPVGTIPEHEAATEIDEVEQLIERYRIAGMLASLHPEEAEVLRLRFYEDLTQPEIAERTGIALGTVKMRMVSGLERLRRLMEDER